MASQETTTFTCATAIRRSGIENDSQIHVVACWRETVEMRIGLASLYDRDSKTRLSRLLALVCFPALLLIACDCVAIRSTCSFPVCPRDFRPATSFRCCRCCCCCFLALLLIACDCVAIRSTCSFPVYPRDFRPATSFCCCCCCCCFLAPLLIACCVSSRSTFSFSCWSTWF